MVEPIPDNSTKSVRSVCPYCGVGCGMVLNVKDNKIVRVLGDRDHPSSEGRLCTKGNTAGVPVDNKDRLTKFQFRASIDRDFEAIAPDAALDQVAATLKKILEESGPDSLAFYVSGQMSTESQYACNKLAKGFWGTNNIDSNSRLCMASAASGYKQSFGADSPEASYSDIDHADAFFAIGSNMADCHPILHQRVMRRMKDGGAKLIVVDPRFTDTAKGADLFLQIMPGTDLALLNGLLNGLIQRGKIDDQFVAEHTEGLEETIRIVASYSLSKTSKLTGLSVESLESALDILCEANAWMSFWTMGLNQSRRGTAHTAAICNLHLLTGQLGKVGAGPFSLTGQPNAMGGREVGYLSAGLPGQRAVANAADRARVEDLWGVEPGTIQPKPGPVAQDMFDKVHEGKIRAVWVIGTNPVASMPRNGLVAKALEKADCVIVQDVFEGNETSKYAHYMLPGALWAEAEGTMVNSERRITLMQEAVSPPGEAMADWEIICEIAKRMGYSGFDFANASEVFEEIKTFRNEATQYILDGVTYDRLRETSLQWPCYEKSSLGLSKRYGWRYDTDFAEEGISEQVLRFATPSGRAQFVQTPYTPDPEKKDSSSLTLNTGRYPHQWHTLTKTGRVDTLNRLNGGPKIEINAQDAERIGIEDGTAVEVKSEIGIFKIPASISEDVLPGQCFAPIHWNQAFQEDGSVNAATIAESDPVSLQPALKSAEVSIIPTGEKIPTAPSETKTSEEIEYEDGYEMASRSVRLFRGAKGPIALIS
ncbi:MAG: molybdopterin oxidoreductase family protein [Opitutales bacterium]